MKPARAMASWPSSLRELVDESRARRSGSARPREPVPLAQPRGDLASLISARYSETRLSSMVLSPALEQRLRRVLIEQRQQQRLRAHGLRPRRKLLLLGPPGAGKTMTAAALAGELHMPLFTIVLDGLMTKFMGETAAKLRLVFDAIAETRGVYFFDEFDAIGAKRTERNDVGEICRVLNSFLQFLEGDDSDSLIIAATNHPELLDPALYRRFDDVIEYSLPDSEIARRILENRALDLQDQRDRLAGSGCRRFRAESGGVCAGGGRCRQAGPSRRSGNGHRRGSVQRHRGTQGYAQALKVLTLWLTNPCGTARTSTCADTASPSITRLTRLGAVMGLNCPSATGWPMQTS